MSLLVPIEKVEQLGEMNFSLIMISTIVVDGGKFWKKGLYTNGEDTIHVSHEIGDAYPKDPIITICGCNETISRVVEEMLDIAIECNEYQFVENIRRFIETQEKFVVNRKLTGMMTGVGLATLPEEEFSRYSAICYRKSLNSTVICRVPFINGFYKRAYNEGEILHAASNLKFPKMSIPYYRMRFSLNVWGRDLFFHI